MNYQDRERNRMHEGERASGRHDEGRGWDMRDGRGESQPSDGRASSDRFARSDGYGRALDGGRYADESMGDGRWSTDRWSSDGWGHDRSSADRWSAADHRPSRRDGLEGYGRGRGEVAYGYVRTGGRDFARESDRYEGRAESMREREARMDDVRPAGIGEYIPRSNHGGRGFASEREQQPSPYGRRAQGYGLDGYANDGRFRGNRDLGEGGFDSPNFGSMRAIDEGRFGGERAPRPWTSGEMRTAGRPPKGYTRTDERVKEDLCDRLSASGHDWSEVEVSVSGGEVTLTGTVTDRAHKFEAEHIADGVRGVTEVTNQLRVQAAGSSDHGARTERGEATDRATGSGNGNGNGKESKAKSARAH